MGFDTAKVLILLVPILTIFGGYFWFLYKCWQDMSKVSESENEECDWYRDED